MQLVLARSSIRLLLAALVAAAVVLWARPAAGSDGIGAQRDAFVRWADEVAVPRLIAAATPNESSAAYWSNLTATRGATERAVAFRLASLMAEGRWERVPHYAALLTAMAGPEAQGGLLADLVAAAAAAGDAPNDSPLDLADRALDEGDYALAAMAYRVALLVPDEAGSERDLSGHFLYCLHRLGAAPASSAAQARFLRAVVFPSVEAGARARAAARAADDPSQLTSATP